jgi:magnesium transporter
VETTTIASNSVVASVAYSRAGRRTREVPIDDISDVLEKTDEFVWIGLYEPGEALLRKVQEEFSLHDLAIEDALVAHQRPKIERYDESLFVVLRTAQLKEKRTGIRVEFGETHFFLGRRYVVTVRHGSPVPHTSVRTRCESTPELLENGPAFVLYALMDFIVDQYFPVVDALEEELEKLEDRIFRERFNPRTTGQIYQLKRELLSLKRVVAPVIEMCGRLIRWEDNLIPMGTRPYFRDVYDHALRINEMIDTVRDLLGTALEAHLSMISVSQNEDVRRLAAWAAIIAVPTMVAGVYGMNFDVMPELRWTYGYPLVVGATAAICATLYTRFKKNNWL